MFQQVCNYFVWGMTYSIAGWIWEVILFCFTEKKFINRGFVFGPVCPIYGAGALAMWGIFGVWLQWRNIFTLFFLGGLLACVMEYIISYGLEKIFHQRWWDYTRNRFNINGRVCPLGFTAFGVFCVLVVRWVQPFIIWVTSLIPDLIIMSVAITLVVTFGMDLLVTVGKLCKLDVKLAQLRRKHSTP